jgi:hypothetical protein
MNMELLVGEKMAEKVQVQNVDYRLGSFDTLISYPSTVTILSVLKYSKSATFFSY